MDDLLIVAVVAGVLLVLIAEQHVERARRRVTERPPSGAAHPLSPYDLAYLAGGPRRAVNTALTVLATAGAVRVSRAGISLVYGARPSPVPIEQAVIDFLASRTGGCAPAELRRALGGHEALTAIADDLTRRGLLVPEAALGPARQRQRWQVAALVAAIGIVATAIGLAVTGMMDDLGHLPVLLLFGGFSVIYGAAAILRRRRRLRLLVTREGRAALTSARGRHPRGATGQGSVALAVGIPVALYGLPAAGDPVLTDELSRGDPGGDVSGSCGSHGDGSSGFGDGSGGFGGGDFGGGGGGSGCGGGGGGGGCGGGGGGGG
jgi:uncharacterized protein (TIGR04222 family)